MEVHKLFVSHAVTTENHLFRVNCDCVHEKFAYAINMHCEIIVLHSSAVFAYFFAS